jgi:hypothetical protein
MIVAVSGLIGLGAAVLTGALWVLTLIENDQCCSSKVTTLACSG